MKNHPIIIKYKPLGFGLIEVPYERLNPIYVINKKTGERVFVGYEKHPIHI